MVENASTQPEEQDPAIVREVDEEGHDAPDAPYAPGEVTRRGEQAESGPDADGR